MADPGRLPASEPNSASAAASVQAHSGSQNGVAPEGVPGNASSPEKAEAGLDMSDFEELLDHLKTSDYSPGDFVFRYPRTSHVAAAL